MTDSTTIHPTRGIVFDAHEAHCSTVAFDPDTTSLSFTDVSAGLGNGRTISVACDPFNANRFYALQSDGLYVNDNPFAGGAWSPVAAADA